MHSLLTCKWSGKIIFSKENSLVCWLVEVGLRFAAMGGKSDAVVYVVVMSGFVNMAVDR